MQDKYRNYSSEDLVADPVFRAWVLEPTEERDAFWKRFLDRYPEKAATIDEARLLLQSVWEYFEREPTSREQLLQYFETVKETAVSSRPRPQPRRSKSLVWRRMRAAAAVSLLLLAGLGYLLGWFDSDPLIYQTAFGERLEVVLPDSSVVDLNANSKLTVSRDWNKVEREVWLEGEAFFTVRRKPATNAKFTVHTQGLDIEVLGTAFNVNTRQKKVEVLLKEGKVKLLSAAEELFLDPGEVADFSAVTKRITKREVEETDTYISWREGYLIYERTSIKEVITDIEDIYGLEITVSDSTLFNRTIRGALPTDDLEECLIVMESLFEVQVVRGDGAVLLEQKKTD